MDVVQSNEEPKLTLFRYNKGNNLMVLDKKNEDIYINPHKIWSHLGIIFGLNNDDIEKLIKVWLDEVYNLRGVVPHRFQHSLLIQLD
jgi:hypothetical protein